MEYIVKFEEGYYANKQPYYNWSFTDKLPSAMVYQTMRNARKRADYPSQYGQGTVEAITITDKKIILLAKALADKAMIEDESARLTKRFKTGCLADGDDFEEFLKIKLNKFKMKIK